MDQQSQQQQHHRRLEGSTAATGGMNAHPPFRLFQALSTRYENAAEEPQEVEVSALSSNAFSGVKSNVATNDADGGGGEESTGDGGDSEDGGDDGGGYNFVAARTHKPVPECTPRPSRVPRTPTIVANDEDNAGDRIEVSSEQDSLESPAASLAGEATGQSDSDSIAVASAATVFHPLSSANFTTASSIIVSQANSSVDATSPEVLVINSSASAGDPPGPALNASSSSPASVSSPGIGNSNSGSIAGNANQTTGSSNVGAGGDPSDTQVSAGFPTNSTQPALAVSPAKPGIASNSSSPCIPMSVEGDATYCVPQGDPDLGALSCSGVAAPMQASALSVDLNRICPRKGDTAMDTSSCHPQLRSFNATTKSCVAPEDSHCIVVRTGVWGCSFSFSPSLTGGHNLSTNALDSSSIAVQTMSTATSSLSANQTSEAVEAAAGDEQQQQQQQKDGSTVPGSLLIVTGVLAIALAVLAIVKRKRAQRKAPDQDAVVLHGPSGTYLSYPKTPEVSRATESMHSFT